MPKVRIIDQLREKLGGRWRYCTATREWWGLWPNGKKIYVYACAASAPRYEGDENFVTQYRRKDTGEIVLHEPLIVARLPKKGRKIFASP